MVREKESLYVVIKCIRKSISPAIIPSGTHKQILQVLLSSKERPVNARPVDLFLYTAANAGKIPIAAQIGVKVVL